MKVGLHEHLLSLRATDLAVLRSWIQPLFIYVSGLPLETSNLNKDLAYILPVLKQLTSTLQR